ncbi:histidine kinase [Hymenobacter sp. M29]|uniref:Histidine kinase n=1 Tax=Hymenobacter mellowenesis TaxID=3063995 RepID=A0ABT9AFP3_9BACT|nr:sensor histidine kinase [Hymenobacter sp. M29]MDO7848671.1 histidine kinase [Hymenobacter sp. M29]
MLLNAMKMLRWLVAGCLLLAGPVAQGQALEQHPDRGLSTVGVRDIARDAAGFAWVAARQGLFRYDGRQLVPLALLVRRGPTPHGQATRVVVDAAGTVWVALPDGLYAFVPGSGELRRVPLPPGIGPHDRPRSLLLHQGALWVVWGTSSGQAVLQLPLRQPRQVPRLVWRVPGSGGSGALEPDSAGRLLLFNDDSSWVLLPGGRQRRQAPNSHRYRLRTVAGWRRVQPATHALRLPHGPYALNDSTLLELRPPRLPRVLASWPRIRNTPATPHLDVLVHDSTWYWLGAGQLLSLSVRRRAGPPVLHAQPLPLVPGWNGWLAFNRDGTGLWAFAEGVPGVWQLWPRPLAVQALPVADGQHLSTRSLGRLPDGRLLVGTYADTYAQAADSPLAPLRRWASPAGRGVWFCRLALPDGRLLVGLENEGVALVAGSRAERLAWPGLHPQPTGHTTFCLLRSRAGQLWAGGQEGLFLLDLATRTRRRYREVDAAWPLHRCEIEAMAEGAHGELWLATSQGLYALQPATGALRHYGPDEPPPRRLPTGLLRAVLLTHPDSLWLGTADAGLLLLHPRLGVRRQLTRGRGLPSEVVAFVLAPPPGRVLWVGTDLGLVRYDPRTGRRSDLTTAQGLATNDLNRQSAWYDTARQRLYVGGVGGLSFLAPQALAAAEHRPRLLLTTLTQHHAQPDTIRTDYLPGTLPQGLTLAPGDAFADLALSLSDDDGPEPARFAYRLLGSGPAAWQELGTSNRLRLQGLEPGDYTLELRGETGLGTPARHVLRVPVRARIYWWRRPGVWAALTGLLVAVAAGSVYQWQQRRSWQREQYWQAEHALRQRIAADLHDDVGNLLTQISMHSSLLRETAHSPAQTVARLDALAAASRQASQQMSDVVWGLDAEHLRLGQLLDRMRDHAQEVLPPAGLNVRFQVPADLPDPDLAPDLLHNLYLIYKEALHNVVKHARATTVTVQLTAATGLTLTVTDDGHGHDGQPRPGGHGLANMQARARAVGGTVCYQPLPTGFAVVVKLPLG